MSDMPIVRIVEKKGGIGQQEKPLTIVFCVPGSSFSGTFFRHWTDFIIKCMLNGIHVILSNAEDAVIYYVRNKALGGDVLRGIHQKPFDGKIPYDYLMWVDSDVIFSYDHFYRLLTRNLPIIAGMYQTADGVTYPVVTKWDTEFFKSHGYFQFLTDADIKDKKDPFEVVYTGFGFILVKHGVFESLEYPWFRPLTQNISEKIVDFSAEDVSFCQLIREKGFKIFVDPTVIVGHEKRKIILPER